MNLKAPLLHKTDPDEIDNHNLTQTLSENRKKYYYTMNFMTQVLTFISKSDSIKKENYGCLTISIDVKILNKTPASRVQQCIKKYVMINV